MPTFRQPSADAAEAAESLRGLAHATRQVEDPSELYSVLGSLSAGLASLEQTLHQLGHVHDRPQHDRPEHDPVHDPVRARTGAGRAASYQVSWELHRAAEIVRQVAVGLDRAHEVEGTIAYDAPGFRPITRDRHLTTDTRLSL